MATKKQHRLKQSTHLQEVQLPPGYVMVPQVAPQAAISPSATPSGKLHVSDQLVALIFMLVLAGLLLTNEFNLISFFDVSQGAPSEAPVYVSPSHFGRESACQPPLICPEDANTEVFSNQPVVPVAPQAPAAPVAPQVPVAPQAPAAPVAPQVPVVPEVPAPVAPEATAIPQAPAAAQGSEQPTAPEAAIQEENPIQPTAQVEPQTALENQATDNPNPSESAAPAEEGGSDACHPPMVCDPSVPAAPVATAIPEQAAPPIEIPEKPSVLVPSEVNGYVSPSDFGQQPSQCHPPQICRADE